MTHLAIDLGSTNAKSDGIWFDPEQPGNYRTVRFTTTRSDLRDLVERNNPKVIIIESCRPAEWVAPFLEEMGVVVLIANTNSDAFRETCTTKRRKTDRLDAERLMRLFLLNDLETLTLASSHARYSKRMIDLRRAAVKERVTLQVRVRHLLDGAGLVFRPGKSGWTEKSLATLTKWTTTPPEDVPPGMWQELLAYLLRALKRLCEEIKELTMKIDAIQAEDVQATALRAVPGIGCLTALSMAATIDDPHRFRSSKQVSRYSGFSPEPYESGKTQRRLGISRRSWSTVRGYLYEACQIGVHRCKDPWMTLHYQRLKQQTGSRCKAMCALARRVFVACWRMLKNGLTWEQITAPALKAATTPAT